MRTMFKNSTTLSIMFLLAGIFVSLASCGMYNASQLDSYIGKSNEQMDSLVEFSVKHPVADINGASELSDLSRHFLAKTTGWANSLANVQSYGLSEGNEKFAYAFADLRRNQETAQDDKSDKASSYRNWYKKNVSNQDPSVVAYSEALRSAAMTYYAELPNKDRQEILDFQTVLKKRFADEVFLDSWPIGIWHGIRSPVMLVGSFFSADWKVFSVNHRGGEYFLGFWGGVVILLFILAALGNRRKE